MPKKPKTKPAAKRRTAKAAPETEPAVPKEHPETALNVAELPAWVDYQPLADFRLIAWESDETAVEVLLTSQEYGILKDHLARLRGYAPAEASHAN